jgi:hypothetical protein
MSRIEIRSKLRNRQDKADSRMYCMTACRCVCMHTNMATSIRHHFPKPSRIQIATTTAEQQTSKQTVIIITIITIINTSRTHNLTHSIAASKRSAPSHPAAPQGCHQSPPARLVSTCPCYTASTALPNCGARPPSARLTVTP